jgi:hypothetical protein
VVVKTEVTQHHGGGKDHRSGVGLVTALDVETDVTATGLEDSVLTAHVGTRDDAGTTNESSTDVGQDGSVQVRHDQHVKLLGPGDSLHGRIVDNHVVDLETRVLLGNLVERLAEETVGQLHDVGLVDAGNLLAPVGGSKRESELGDPLGLHLGDNLEGLDNTRDRLVLEAGVLSLRVLTDDAHVNVGVAGLVSRHVLDHHNRGVDVQLLPQGNVPRLVAGALHGGVQNAYERDRQVSTIYSRPKRVSTDAQIASQQQFASRSFFSEIRHAPTAAMNLF